MKEPSFFVDTNIFLRVCVRDNQVQAKHCQSVIRAIQRGDITAVTSETIMAEFVWTALSCYKLSKSVITPMVKALLALPNLHIQGTPNLLVALELYENHSIKFIDAVIASYELVQLGQLPILSYDKDFDKIGIQRYEPVDIINSLEQA